MTDTFTKMARIISTWFLVQSVLMSAPLSNCFSKKPGPYNA